MTFRINLNLYPKNGGHVFKESDGTTHRADTWPGVIARVKLYRKRNNLPEGDPESEIYAQACQSNPSICSKETAETKRKQKEVSLKGRLLSWLSRKKQQKQLSFVDKDVMDRRSKTCASCPQNQALTEGCSSCRAAVAAMREELLGDRKINARLNGCVILGHDCAVAVHLDEVRVDEPDLPAHCWRKIGGASE